MKVSARLLPLVSTLSVYKSKFAVAETCDFFDPLPINSDDFNQPDWVAIIEKAFPPWATPANGCPRLDKVGGKLLGGYDKFPVPEEGKFNPCYYTKAFAGLDPMLGGYPTPIDTRYPYEFAAPFLKQPGDGSTHHCPIDSPPHTKIQTCPKVAPKCPGGEKDCNLITDEFGIGHVPPFVPLAAIKNAYFDCKEDACDWFHDTLHPCNIPKSVLDRLTYDSFGVNGTIKFTPPIILEDVPAESPKSTYYKLEYVGDEEACADDNCIGPRYCSKDAAVEDVWGDFCPYIHTGENSGLYRHPHIALAALELMIANKCNPEKCPSTWLDSPNGKDYGSKETSTSITWAEMEDNSDQIAQPAVPYKWPNAGDGIFPGHELYGGLNVKPAAGSYVTKFVAVLSEDPKPSAASTSFVGYASITLAVSIALSLL